MKCVYLNHAATSHPKPPEVQGAVVDWFREPPADPGRDSGCREDPLSRCRAEIASLFNVAEPHQVILVPSATYALNLVLRGLLDTTEHLVTTRLEHNSLTRPAVLQTQRSGAEIDVVPPTADGRIEPEEVARRLRPGSSVVALSHASNVTGAIQPIAEIAGVAAAAGVPMLVDASQSAGVVDIDYGALPGRVFVAFSGHKGLLGPPGVGGLLVPDADLPHLVVGGTGVRSELVAHPPDLPLRFEAGTPNLPGLAGFAAGVALVRRRTARSLGDHRDRLVRRAREHLEEMPEITCLPLPAGDGRAGIVAFNLAGWDPGELAFVLETSFGIRTRAGLQCAPWAHQAFATYPAGTVRASVGHSTSTADVDTLVGALDTLRRRRQ